MSLESLCLDAVTCRVCFSKHGLRSAYVDLAQPRWVGPQYWSADPRIVILMLNPGEGKLREENKFFRKILWQFKERQAKLCDVFNYQKADMPNWGRGKFWAFYVEGLGLPIDEIAFANVAWCATKGNEYPRRMLQECFKRHTFGLLKFLKPHAVLLSGAPTHTFMSEVLTAAPNARMLPALHYAHREGTERNARELVRLAEDLRQLGFGGGKSTGPVKHFTSPTRQRQRSRPSQVSNPVPKASGMTSKGALRSAEIARQIGMKPTSRLGNGKYLHEKTRTQNISATVFHSKGYDCVGFAGSKGTDDKRQWVLQRDAKWRKLDFLPHQKRPEDNKTFSTYIKKFDPLPDGKVNPELHQTYKWVLKRFNT